MRDTKKDLGSIKGKNEYIKENEPLGKEFKPVERNRSLLATPSLDKIPHDTSDGDLELKSIPIHGIGIEMPSPTDFNKPITRLHPILPTIQNGQTFPSICPISMSTRWKGLSQTDAQNLFDVQVAFSDALQQVALAGISELRQQVKTQYVEGEVTDMAGWKTAVKDTYLGFDRTKLISMIIDRLLKVSSDAPCNQKKSDLLRLYLKANDNLMKFHGTGGQDTQVALRAFHDHLHSINGSYVEAAWVPDYIILRNIQQSYHEGDEMVIIPQYACQGLYSPVPFPINVTYSLESPFHSFRWDESIKGFKGELPVLMRPENHDRTYHNRIESFAIDVRLAQFLVKAVYFETSLGSDEQVIWWERVVQVRLTVKVYPHASPRNHEPTHMNTTQDSDLVMEELHTVDRRSNSTYHSPSFTSSPKTLLAESSDCSSYIWALETDSRHKVSVEEYHELAESHGDAGHPTPGWESEEIVTNPLLEQAPHQSTENLRANDKQRVLAGESSSQSEQAQTAVRSLPTYSTLVSGIRLTSDPLFPSMRAGISPFQDLQQESNASPKLRGGQGADTVEKSPSDNSSYQDVMAASLGGCSILAWFESKGHEVGNSFSSRGQQVKSKSPDIQRILPEVYDPTTTLRRLRGEGGPLSRASCIARKGSTDSVGANLRKNVAEKVESWFHVPLTSFRCPLTPDESFGKRSYPQTCPARFHINNVSTRWSLLPGEFPVSDLCEAKQFGNPTPTCGMTLDSSKTMGAVGPSFTRRSVGLFSPSSQKSIDRDILGPAIKSESFSKDEALSDQDKNMVVQRVTESMFGPQARKVIDSRREDCYDDIFLESSRASSTELDQFMDSEGERSMREVDAARSSGDLSKTCKSTETIKHKDELEMRT